MVAMLVLSVCLVWLIYGWLSSAIKYGDPTRNSNPETHSIDF